MSCSRVRPVPFSNVTKCYSAVRNADLVDSQAGLSTFVCCVCRCAFMHISKDNPAAQSMGMLHHAKPWGVIWADTSIKGGFGPLPGLPHNCQAIQFVPSIPRHLPPQRHADVLHATDIAQELADKPTSKCKTAPILDELVAQWHAAVRGSALLPFCYVMHTSGSTGQPNGVCGTEAGWCCFSVQPWKPYSELLTAAFQICSTAQCNNVLSALLAETS